MPPRRPTGCPSPLTAPTTRTSAVASAVTSAIFDASAADSAGPSVVVSATQGNSVTHAHRTHHILFIDEQPPYRRRSAQPPRRRRSSQQHHEGTCPSRYAGVVVGGAPSFDTTRCGTSNMVVAATRIGTNGLVLAAPSGDESRGDAKGFAEGVPHCPLPPQLLQHGHLWQRHLAPRRHRPVLPPRHY